MDPFLAAHKWSNLPLFDLASRLSTIAIRDQMIRAIMLADRLPSWLETNLGLGFRERPVLVIGGGACGISAAIRLAQQGIKVEVVEKSESLFALQRQCTTRWVDPTQYDWPHEG